jgi:hypothetical protein
MPPPHELQRTPEPISATEIESPGIRARDFAYNGQEGHPRRNSIDSQGSTIHSKASTALSQMDLVTPPHTAAGRNGSRRNLSVIPEDTSSNPSPNGSSRDRSINSDHRMPFPPLQAPDFGAASGRSGDDRDMDSHAQLQEARLRDKQMNQKMADELRYSDPSQVEEWRRAGVNEVK